MLKVDPIQAIIRVIKRDYDLLIEDRNDSLFNDLRGIGTNNPKFVSSKVINGEYVYTTTNGILIVNETNRTIYWQGQLYKL